MMTGKISKKDGLIVDVLVITTKSSEILTNEKGKMI